MTTLAEAAADAFLAGWTLTGTPFTGHAEAGMIAAAGTALEFRTDPGILEAALTLGHAEGTAAGIRVRSDRLMARHLRAVAAAWDACMADLDPHDLARRFRSAIYLPAETVTKDPAKRWWQDTAIATALGWLRGVYHTAGYAALVAAVEDAIRSGMAEGEAGALAMAAAQQGKTGFAIDRAFTAAYDRLADDHDITRQAADAITQVIDGTAYDTGRRLARLAGEGAGEDDMAGQAGDLTSGRDSSSRNWFGDVIWAAVAAGAKALWSRLTGSSDAAILVTWIAQPGACVACEENAANSPYAPQDVPQMPQHRNCRCSLSSDSRVPGSWLSAFLAGDD